MRLFFIIIILKSFSVFSQEKTLNDFFLYLRNEKYEDAIKIIKNNNNSQIKEDHFLFLVELVKNKGVRYKEGVFLNDYSGISNEDNDLFQSTLSKVNLALYNYYFIKNPEVSIYSIYTQSLKDIENTNFEGLKREIIRRILEYHDNIIIIQDYTYVQYIKMYKELATDEIDIAIADYYELVISIKNSKLDLTKEDFEESKRLSKILKIKSFNIKLNIILGNYLEENRNKNQALKYYTYASNQLRKDSLGSTVLSLLDCKLNLGILNYQNRKYNKAISFLKEHESFEGKLIVRKKIYFDYWLYKVYKEKKEFKEALKSLERSRANHFSFNQRNHLKTINEIETKYQTEKKEKENLQLKQDNLRSEAKRKQNQNLFLGALTILFFGGIIYYQKIKSSKRKRLLAEQQKELEQQKNITLLKEQEITTINAMVDGQEKERIRIAEDLHDNIGSVLATLKLHFENLKFNREKKTFNQEDLYNKTENLIDEAYLKVRSIAHAKNAGVIANKGLLVAVKIMAEKISDANKISIEVLDFGLDKRLENTIELTVFRIIQELITNIIKHAEATQATINLSLYDDNLNIIIEDNGIGFSVKNVDFKSEGMGLGSIKTRVKYLNGSFDIDSTKGKGSSVLINIPV